MDLDAWLQRIEKVHPRTIELTLERIAEVARNMGLLPFCHPVIMVGGTNGKGTTVATLMALAKAANKRAAAYTSPHLHHYRERFNIDGRFASDAELVEALEAIDQGRGETQLTYFEFSVLAALWLFSRQTLDVVILEVGLGGRLDAINIVDADVAIITSIALDHTEFLGDTREKIGFEKAGIGRKGRPLICGDRDCPASIIDYAQTHQIPLQLIGKDFDAISEGQQWQYRDQAETLAALPVGTIPMSNQACALAAWKALWGDMTGLCAADVADIMQQVQVPGRMQRYEENGVHYILDVAHNPAAAKWLAAQLDDLLSATNQRCIAVYSSLETKDINGVLEYLEALVDHWIIAPLETNRAAPLASLEAALSAQSYETADDIDTAMSKAHSQAQAGDWVVVFGSFFTVAAAADYLAQGVLS